MVVFGQGKNLLFKSILGHCDKTENALSPTLHPEYLKIKSTKNEWTDEERLIHRAVKIPRKPIKTTKIIRRCHLGSMSQGKLKDIQFGIIE